jgi:hypothetical protein
MTRAEAKLRMKQEILLLRESLAMPTTGNREQDDAHLTDAAISSALIAANFCPNGCGEMDNNIPGQASCPKCGFTLFRRSL